jgi:glycosyltransferase involved in cell wall biosynthesis
VGDTLHVLGVPAPGFVGHYRVRWPLEACRRQGLLDVDFVDQQTLRWRDPCRYDVVVWNRIHSPEIPHVVRHARATSGTVSVWDSDDLELGIPRTNPVHDAYRTDGFRTETQHAVIASLRACDLLTTSTAPLADHLRWFNERVAVLPNEIEPAVWADVEPLPTDPLHPLLMFCGSNTHGESFQLAAPGVSEALRRHPDWHLVLLGFPEAAELLDEDVRWQVLPVPWDSGGKGQSYRRWLASASLLFRPSFDRAFERCKSENPILEAGAVAFTRRREGVPIVASETTYGAALRQADAPELIVRAPEDWAAALDHWMGSAGDRAAAGWKLGVWVEAERTYDRHAGAWAGLYRSLLG